LNNILNIQNIIIKITLLLNPIPNQIINNGKIADLGIDINAEQNALKYSSTLGMRTNNNPNPTPKIADNP
jgi:hypothetical protein